MIKEEFLNKIALTYPNGGTPIMRENIESWIDRTDLTTFHFDVIFNHLVENRKPERGLTYPRLPEIIESYHAIVGKSTSHHIITYTKVLEETRSWAVEKILNKYDEVQNKENAIGWDGLSVWNKHFRYIWESLDYFSWQLRKYRWTEPEIEKYLEGVKSTIGRGERAGYGSHLEDRRTPEERDRTKANKAALFEKLNENFPSVRV